MKDPNVKIIQIIEFREIIFGLGDDSKLYFFSTTMGGIAGGWKIYN